MSAITHPRHSTELPATAAPSVDQQTHGQSARQRLLAMLPTLAVICTLAAIGVWGHFTHWTVPRFSALFGGNTAETTA
jgi:hypothetical protein